MLCKHVTGDESGGLERSTVGLQRLSLVLYNYGCQPAGHGIDLVNCISCSQDHPATCVFQTLHALRKDIKLLTSLVPTTMFIPITLPPMRSFVAAFA